MQRCELEFAGFDLEFDENLIKVIQLDIRKHLLLIVKHPIEM
jgi:hypothetical protein